MLIWGTFLCISMVCPKVSIFGPAVKFAIELLSFEAIRPLVLPCFVFRCMGLWYFKTYHNLQWIYIHFKLSKYMILFNDIVLTNNKKYPNSHNHTWQWFILVHTRQSKTRQDKENRYVASARRASHNIVDPVKQYQYWNSYSTVDVQNSDSKSRIEITHKR